MAFLETSRSYFFALTVATALAACSGDDGSVGESDATSSSSTSDASASSTSNGSATATTTATATASGTGTESGTDSGTSTGEPTTTDMTSTSDPTTGETTTTDPTTTDATTDPTDGTTTEDPTGGVDDNGCDAACDTLVMCIPDYPLEECLDECSADFNDGEGAECQAANSEANMCFATLECDQIFNEDYGECIPVFDAAADACGGGMGMCEADLQKMGKGCRVSFVCGDSQSGMQCNQNNCTCVEDGQQVGQCGNDGFCALDLDAAVAAANECCGWDF